MKTFYVGYDQVARIAHVAETAIGVPEGTTDLGSFQLVEDTEDDLGFVRNQGTHTIFHEVRDKLYAIGEQNMQAVQIVTV